MTNTTLLSRASDLDASPPPEPRSFAWLGERQVTVGEREGVAPAFPPEILERTSLQLSRSLRKKPRNWLARTVGVFPRPEHLGHLELRAAGAGRFGVSAVMESAALRGLPLMRMDWPEVRAAELEAVLARAVSGEARLVRRGDSAHTQYLVDFQRRRDTLSPFFDAIVIETIQSDRPDFEVGGRYVIDGWYRLTTKRRARLCCYVTTREPVGPTAVNPESTTQVERGAGRFRLIKEISTRGWPHLTFYHEGENVGGVYFGAGAWLRES